MAGMILVTLQLHTLGRLSLDYFLFVVYPYSLTLQEESYKTLGDLSQS
jgi:hypothetical protein